MSSSSPKPFPICTIPKEMKQKKSFFIQGHWCLTAETTISPLQLTKGVIKTQKIYYPFHRVPRVTKNATKTGNGENGTIMDRKLKYGDKT